MPRAPELADAGTSVVFRQMKKPKGTLLIHKTKASYSCVTLKFSLTAPRNHESPN